MAFAALIREVVDLDEIGSILLRSEIDHSAGAVHEEVSPLGIGHDDNGREL